MRIPADAIIGGQIPLNCEKVLATARGSVSLLDFAGTRLYAIGDFTGRTTVGLDLSRVEFVGQSVQSVPTTFCLPFTYKKEKGMDGNQRVAKHFCVIDDICLESYYEFNKKMYRLGRRIFREKFRLYLTSAQLRIAEEGETYPCVEGTVCRVLDYGSKCYSEVNIGKQSVFVCDRLPVGQPVTLAVDLDQAQVGQDQSDIILF